MRRKLVISGTVQGVGFRPFVFNLARRFGVGGKVYNSGGRVVVEAEGREEAVARFLAELVSSPPPLARIGEVRTFVLPPAGDSVFTIAGSRSRSRGRAAKRAPVPPDVATCPECKKEVLDPADRRHLYHFTNCTNCGPRFTILFDLPYDRRRTAMSSFPMCPECAREYRDPADRRFHAQPVACPACGPRVELVDRAGRPVAREGWLSAAARLLAQGRILAVKGLGGFHLACAATDGEAVAELRRRKRRPDKPFAVMGRDLETVGRYCLVTPAEEALLRSPAAPIVLLQKRAGCPLPAGLAPGVATLGVMLPYTPLHILLLQEGPPLMVMTSGNAGGLPIVTDNERALAELGGIADYFLMHDREIVNRCDDSVVAAVGGATLFFRRSRGYVPEPVAVPAGKGAPAVLGIGGEAKNTFCLLAEGEAYLSQHIGEVDTLEGRESLLGCINSFCRLTGIKPELITADLHPGYRSSSLADELAKELGVRRHPGVQHHHAHLASCMAENGLEGEVIGIILDGAGYGPDGRLWGFEIARGSYRRYRREFYLAYVPLPGGELAVREPWRTAAAYLIAFLGERGKKAAGNFFADRRRELAVVEKMLAAGINSPPASSCGRFFDAAAALLGLCLESTYEGQAAAFLESLVPWCPAEAADTGLSSFSGFSPALRPYPFAFRGAAIDPAPALGALIEDIGAGKDPALIAGRFHDTIIAMVAEAAEKIREKTGLFRVALSGGAWQNRYLTGVAARFLEERGFQVFRHRLVPPGDGGLALGQAVVAAWQEAGF